MESGFRSNGDPDHTLSFIFSISDRKKPGSGVTHGKRVYWEDVESAVRA